MVNNCVRAAAVLLGFFGVLVEGAGAQEVQFRDVTEQSGIDFVHVNAATGKKYAPETMCAGCGLFDYDGDGDLDAYLVNGAPLPGFETDRAPTNRLYRNEGERGWTFTDVTAASGTGDPGYGMGCAVGDIDNDGDLDLYVTNFGPDVLYRNEGDGTFTDVTAQAGVGNDQWGASAAFLDYDRDGDLDLYVVNYITFALEDNKVCTHRNSDVRDYCHPDLYPGAADVLYRNEGDGTFRDVTREAGIERPDGRGLGVVCTDYDGDGDLDIFVANDSMDNFLFDNLGDGRFEEVGLLTGISFNEMGQAEAGMGVDCADVDGNGFLDILLGHLEAETNTLYLNNGDGTFSDVTASSGIASPTLLDVTFGLVFLDADSDGDPDVFAANGNVLDNIERVSRVSTYKQTNKLLENVGNARFVDASARFGPGLGIRKASRGLAAGDIDNDGDIDLLVANIAEPPDLLRNEGGNRKNWLMVRLIGGAKEEASSKFQVPGSRLRSEEKEGEGGEEPGTGNLELGTGVVQPGSGKFSNRDGIGARVIVVAGDLRQAKEAHSAASYQSAGDLRLHFGLGQRQRVDLVEVRWPSGRVDRIEGVSPNRLLVVMEGEGSREVDWTANDQ